MLQEKTIFYFTFIFNVLIMFKLKSSGKDLEWLPGTGLC